MVKRLTKKRLSKTNIENSTDDALNNGFASTGELSNHRVVEDSTSDASKSAAASTMDLSKSGSISTEELFTGESMSTKELLKNRFTSTEDLSKNGFGGVPEDSTSDASRSRVAETIQLSSECTLTEEDLKDEFEAIADDQTEHSAKKPWVRRLNPFHIGDIPPVPESDAGLVPEMSASWLSKLTWGWMSPLMMVNQTLYSS